MSLRRFARLARSFEQLFPERHLYVRAGGEMRGYILTPGKQMALAGVVAACAMWMGVSTAAMVVGAMTQNHGEVEAAQTQAKYERWIADRQARLNSAMAQLNSSSTAFDDLANSVEQRHKALAMLLSAEGATPGAQVALAPAIAKPAAGRGTALQRIVSVRNDQERLIAAAETFAKNRADRLRLAFRLAGLDPAVYAGRGEGLGGPLIEGKDPRALAAVLDVDEGFAGRIQHAAADLSDVRGLTDAARGLPLARPADGVEQSSGYGVRLDPFTNQPAFHSGQDFSGAYLTPIHATAPGVVSFTGPRAGYGNAVEIDHGHGFKTRYAHLASIAVTVGQKVGVGQRIGGMGSTGRSTGTHLHYEVWVNGRPQNPMRFVKAGDYVQQDTN
ncbi:MAG TPA: peptidoglycan DD-metalloendopeptidase family protein [Caulobacteraceae bacterium]|nr:peptidoglycan DD-metalloendopeptidase family protein [Caulobacteraceae bacterium]